MTSWRRQAQGPHHRQQTLHTSSLDIRLSSQNTSGPTPPRLQEAKKHSQLGSVQHTDVNSNHTKCSLAPMWVRSPSEDSTDKSEKEKKKSQHINIGFVLNTGLTE